MLGRREFSQTWVILPADTAVGTAANWKAYAEDWNQTHLDLVPGQTPTRFLIAQLTEDQKRALAPLSGVDEMNLGIRCALKNVENYNIVGVDGAVRFPKPLQFEEAGTLGSILSEASFRDLGLTTDLQRMPLYIWIRQFSEPQLPLPKPSVPPSGQ